jgi:hypothetical protein
MGSVGEVCLCAALYKLFVEERPSESKVSLSDGLSFVTYTGVSIALDNLKGYIQNSVSGIPADAYALMIMGGFGHAVGIIFGAFAFRATMAAASKLTAVAKK